MCRQISETQRPPGSYAGLHALLVLLEPGYQPACD